MFLQYTSHILTQTWESDFQSLCPGKDLPRSFGQVFLVELDYGLAPLPDLASEAHWAIAFAMPLLCLCYAFLCLHFWSSFILLLCLFCCFQLSLDVTHLQATAAGHCGGHGAHVDAERTGICRVFLGFSFHRSFLFFVISNERYLYATHGLEKEIKNPQNLHSSCGLSCCSSWTRLLCWLRSYLAAETWVIYFLLKRLALTTKRIKRPTFGGQICAWLNIISLPLVHHVFLLHYRCISAVIYIHPSCITRWM